MQVAALRFVSVQVLSLLSRCVKLADLSVLHSSHAQILYYFFSNIGLQGDICFNYTATYAPLRAYFLPQFHCG